MMILRPLMICLPLLVFSAAARAQAPASSIRETPNWHTQQPPPGTATTVPRWTMQAPPPAAGVGAAAAVPATSDPGKSTLSTSGKVRIPKNLFKMNDGAIIIVGGRQMRAGELKLTLHEQLKRQSNQARSVRAPSRLPPEQRSLPTRDLDCGFASCQGIGHPHPSDHASVAANSGAADRIYANRALSNAVSPDPTTRVARMEASYTRSADPTNKIVEAREYCLKHTVAITGVRGSITPNAHFKVDGVCFGDETGSVEVIGQFPGGKMTLAFDQWNGAEISAVVPSVSGVPDGSVALTIVRSDGVRSAAFQARFLAMRERVPVPGRYWSPSDTVDATGEVAISNTSLTAGLTDNPSAPDAVLKARSSPFSVSVNPACALDDSDATPTVGQIGAIDGWNAPGSPNKANVTVTWTPACIDHDQHYAFETDSQTICQIQFSMHATALCPVGVAP